jgi:hypothetical protein
MIGLIIRLLNAAPKAARAFRDLMVGIALGAPVILGDARLVALHGDYDSLEVAG